jgi:hypothetical protein
MLRSTFVALIAQAVLSGCAERNVRGEWVRSQDGGTYLVVDEQDGPACNTIYIDKQRWPHKLHEAGKISPGTHQISCAPDAAYLAFEARPGMTYHFNYWGP